MYIKKLIITTKDGMVVRGIVFHKGLNIIYGEVIQNTSSNNVGKTTLIKSIDFCLGGKIDNFYKDSETKNKDSLIFDFFQKQEPKFQLTLENLDYEIVITREISRGKKENTFEIKNTINCNGSDFDEEINIALNKLLFDSSFKNPSFRNLISNFIRKDNNGIEHVLKFLYSQASVDIYSVVHLFLFGFNDKKLLNDWFIAKSDFKKIYEKINLLYDKIELKKLKELQENIEVIDSELEQELNEFKKSFLLEFNDNGEIEDLRRQYIDYSEQIEKIKANLYIKNKRLEKARKAYFNDDYGLELELLYAEAKENIGNFNMDFNRLVAFHNKMLSSEIKYIEKSIEKENQELENLVKNIDVITSKYNLKINEVFRDGVKEDLNLALDKVLDKHKEQTLASEKLKNIQDLSKKEEEFNNFNNILLDSLGDVEKALGEINLTFSEVTKNIIEKESTISIDSSKDIKFTIDKSSANSGSGRKQCITLLYGLAYLQYLVNNNIRSPYFFVCDKIELIDIKELEEIFKLSKDMNAQLIIPIIKDKFDALKDNYKDYIILSLDEKNKFFRI